MIVDIIFPIDDIRKGTYDDNMPSSGSLDPLEAFYDAMIKAYGPKDQQHMPKGLRVKGAQYKNAWIIAQVKFVFPSKAS